MKLALCRSLDSGHGLGWGSRSGCRLNGALGRCPRLAGGASQGVLLIEAVLAATVIAVGLVFISRGLASQLRTIRTVEEYQTLLSLAQGRLVEWEGELLVGRPLPPGLAGQFDEPYQAYQWSIATEARDDLPDQDGRPLAGQLVLTVQRNTPPATTVTLWTVWPLEWFPSQ